MSIKKKLAIIIVLAVGICNNFQITCAKDYTPIAIPIPSSLKDYKPIPIPIPKTRGNEKFDLNPQPGYDVTLFMKFTVHFAWSNKYSGNDSKKKFVIKDKNGKKIFEKTMGDENSIDILPDKAKLKAGEKYSWSVGDNPKSYDFQILDEQTENELLKNLAEIDSENLLPEECAVKKSAYLQMLSAMYPENFDFYWLIAQWLSEISSTDKEILEKKAELLKRCSLHLDEEMR